MDLKQQITAIERFKKTLGNLSFTVSITADGSARVKFKKKIVIAECPDKAFAEVFAESLNTVVKTTHGKCEDILNHLSLQCEQLSVFDDQVLAKGTSLGNGSSNKISHYLSPSGQIEQIQAVEGSVDMDQVQGDSNIYPAVIDGAKKDSPAATIFVEPNSVGIKNESILGKVFRFIGN